MILACYQLPFKMYGYSICAKLVAPACMLIYLPLCTHICAQSYHYYARCMYVRRLLYLEWGQQVLAERCGNPE